MLNFHQEGQFFTHSKFFVTKVFILASRTHYFVLGLLRVAKPGSPIIYRSDKIYDVYDAKIWKGFLQVSGHPFLSAPHCFGLMLNIDWFQLFKHSIYSVGVIYLTIMNLPRTQRFKCQNIILLGIIPGLSEPALDMNTLLFPLVKELTKFWDGITMHVCNGLACDSILVGCALLCCACDLPARRKVCGFLGHSASLGCSKCLKSFPGTVGKMNYSGFDRSSWTLRSAENHRHRVNLLTQCKTKSELALKESQLGCRYSVLMILHEC